MIKHRRTVNVLKHSLADWLMDKVNNHIRVLENVRELVLDIRDSSLSNPSHFQMTMTNSLRIDADMSVLALADVCSSWSGAGVVRSRRKIISWMRAG